MPKALLLAAAAVLVLASVPTHAQTPIQAGQSLGGRLDASDPALGDGSHYDQYVYRGGAGDRIVVTLRSPDFDAFLHWGTLAGSAFTSLDTDDDGAGGTDARLEVTVGASGTHVVRVNSLGPGETGAYTLSVERAGGAAPAPRPSPGPAPRAEAAGTITAGQTVSGRLDGSDSTLGDGSHYDEYVYQGRAGERIIITLRSAAFDAYLHWGTLRGGAFSPLESDDDGAGGTDSRLEVTVGSGGTHAIRANSLSAGQTGAYTLSVARGGETAAPGPSGSRTLRAGQTVSGRLAASDPRLGDDSHYHQYLYEGRAGEEVVVTLTSSDFDAFLRWGRMQGGRYDHQGFDDDGAGGTNARLRVTLDRAGTYAFQANTFAAGQTGSYTLSLESAATSSTAGLPTIALGQTVNGRLDASDARLPDNSHYDVYLYRGRPGEQVTVTLRSTDFDAYLGWGRMAGGQFEAEQRDDDSGGGTDAQLVGTVGAGGTFAILANSLGAGETGRYTLSVQAAGAARPTGQRPTPAGTATIAAGQAIRGTLARGDLLLADSSWVDQYVYQGTPGERIEITLESSDFDAYLRWGRLADGRFAEEANDDDGGGGTNSRLSVTVGGTGSYAVQANAFAPGTGGSYTLSVRSLGAAPAGRSAEAERQPSSLAGKWIHAYVEPRLARHRPLGDRMKQARMLEQVVDGLNRQFPLPRNVDVRMAHCDMINAFYSPRQASITFCYEMVEFLAQTFARGATEWTQEQRDAVEGAYSFIMMHEVGHALIHQLDLPITGREEDAVDQLSALTLITSGEKGARAALNGALALQSDGAVYDTADFAGEHSLGPQRLFNVMCWVYGSDTQKYEWVVSRGGLPRERAVRCPAEYERMSKAWQRILEPHVAR